MEQVDLIDNNDQVIGQASRAESHNNANLVHRAVHFTLIDPKAKKVLITRRSYTKSHDAGKLCFLGEHVTAGEDYKEAAQRGVKEELNSVVTVLHEVGEHIFSGSNFTERVKMFLAEYTSDGNLSFDKNEIEEVEWCTPEQLKSLEVSEMTRFWINNVDWAKVLKLDAAK